MNPIQVVASKAMFDKPKFVTHRINEKGNSIVHGLNFSSGKTLRGGKKMNNEVITND